MATIIDFATRKVIHRDDEEERYASIGDDNFTCVIVVDGKEVKYPAPRTAEDYLKMCKAFLHPIAYEKVLCGCLDQEIYEELSEQHQKIVDCYQTYLQ